MECPIPIGEYPRITLAHGSGGRLMNQLIEEIFYAAFANDTLLTGHDGAVLPSSQGRLAFTTDSYVVQPLIFPGGDIGSMAVHGTVNDLAMCGAKPLYLSASFILEEGLEMALLWQIVQSMAAAAKLCDVPIVTGDTKVVQKGKGDGMFINTTGIGEITHGQSIAPSQVQVGDAVLISGDIGRHGMAVMAAREGLELSPPIESDSAPLYEPVLALLEAEVEVHCLRDATRGGVAAVLNEIAGATGLQIDIDETALPIHETVRGACEILGLDPLHVANEGCFIACIPQAQAEQALNIMKTFNPLAAIIGEVTENQAGLVTIETAIGGKRILDLPAGELLPRIC